MRDTTELLGVPVIAHLFRVGCIQSAALLAGPLLEEARPEYLAVCKHSEADGVGPESLLRECSSFKKGLACCRSVSGVILATGSTEWYHYVRTSNSADKSTFKKRPWPLLQPRSCRASCSLVEAWLDGWQPCAALPFPPFAWLVPENRYSHPPSDLSITCPR